MPYTTVVSPLLFSLSPEHLALLGRGLGALSLALPLALALSAGLLGGLAPALARPGRATQVLLLTSRLLLLAVFGTLVCGTAGYVFNEVFIYWFPNLLFSFLLLGFSGIAHTLLPAPRLAVLQRFLLAAALAALACLAAASLDVAQPRGDAADLARFDPALLLAAPVLLAGFDLALDRNGRFSPRAGWLALALLVLVHSVLSLVLLEIVEGERLLTSTVSHMTAARRILGETGRMLMGGAMLATAAGGLIALLNGIARIALPDSDQGTPGRRALVSAMACALPALLLGLGFAGKELTTDLILGALATLFLTYAQAGWAHAGRGGTRNPHALTASGVCLLLAGCLLLAAERSFLAFGVVLVAILAACASSRYLPLAQTNHEGDTP